jgi:hypothetical protein
MASFCQTGQFRQNEEKNRFQKKPDFYDLRFRRFMSRMTFEEYFVVGQKMSLSSFELKSLQSWYFQRNWQFELCNNRRRINKVRWRFKFFRCCEAFVSGKMHGQHRQLSYCSIVMVVCWLSQKLWMLFSKIK